MTTGDMLLELGESLTLCRSFVHESHQRRREGVLVTEQPAVFVDAVRTSLPPLHQTVMLCSGHTACD